MFFIQLTDFHMRDPAANCAENSRENFVTDCLQELAKAYPGADVCVITGDLADQGEPGAYRWLKGQLDDLPFPTFPLLGNHDDRQVFLDIFETQGIADRGFIQSEFQLGGAVLIFLDTLKPGSDAGILCKVRMAWLEERLKANRNKTIAIFMHHPPCKIGDPVLDQIRLENAKDFGSVLARAPNVGRIFCGHVHRNFSTIWNGIPVSCLDRLHGYDDGQPLKFRMDAVVGKIENDKFQCSTISLTQGADGVVSFQHQVSKRDV
jgi:Icc protein